MREDEQAGGQPGEQPLAAPEVLFFENGASWYWLLAGPLSALSMLLMGVIVIWADLVKPITLG